MRSLSLLLVAGITAMGSLSGCGFLESVTEPSPVVLPPIIDRDSVSAAIDRPDWQEYFSDDTLRGLIEIGLKNQFDLAIALQRIESARANLYRQTSLLYPTVSIGGSTRITKYGRYTSDFAGNAGTEIAQGQAVPNPLPDFFLGLQSTWELDIAGKYRSLRDAAAQSYLATVEGRRWAMTTLIADIAALYYSLRAQHEEENTIKESITLQQRALTLITVQKYAGRANELAVQQAQAQLFGSDALLLENNQRIVETESALNLLLGRVPQSIYVDTTGLASVRAPRLRSGIKSNFLLNRPDIRKAELELEAARSDVSAARAAFFPSLNITASAGFEAFNMRYLFLSPQSITYNALGNLVAPLINRSAIEADYQSAKADQLIAYFEYQKSILNGFVEVRDEISSQYMLDTLIAVKTAEVAALTEAVRASDELFRTGRATYLEVILAQQNALQTELELTEVRKQRCISSIKLYTSLGGGWPD